MKQTFTTTYYKFQDKLSKFDWNEVNNLLRRVERVYHGLSEVRIFVPLRRVPISAGPATGACVNC